MKWIIWPVFTLLAIFSAWGFKQTPADTGVANATTIFREDAARFAAASREMETAMQAITPGKPASIEHAKAALKKCRLAYKHIEYFLDYFFFSSSMVYNRPAKTEIDEPYMEYQSPAGLQQMAVLLFDKNPYAHKQALLDQANLISSSAADLPALLYQFKATDKDIMESLRIELVRLYANGITGYDAPELKSGIAEAAQSMHTILAVLQPWLSAGSPETQAVSRYLAQCISYLELHTDFNGFNRMEFLTTCALPLQESIGHLIRHLQLDQHTRSALNYDAKNLFSKDALRTAAFPGGTDTGALLVKLGRQLFYDRALSGNGQRNCATCHQPDKYFSDGLQTSLAIDEKNHVRRNAPSLYYAAFQYAQFWDGRANTLSKQIQTVIANPEEMNGHPDVILSRLNDSSAYRQAFAAAFPGDSAPAISMTHLSAAIAAYLFTLSPQTSAFDAYLAGDKKAMTPAQVNGFNLFMGKGQCATCHFAPLFNGLTPPLYQITEFENLGMPGNGSLHRPQVDKDAGRFEYFPIAFYQRAFKTPTVRNAAMTAPYMHNGAFGSLEEVMDFYNAGGGNGLGMKDPYQTLTATKLGLSTSEMKDIIAFLKALSDRPATTYNY